MAYEDGPRADELFRLIERKYGERIAEAFGQSVEELRDRYSIDELAREIEARGIAAADTLLAAGIVTERFQRVGDEYAAAVEETGRRRAQDISGKVTGPAGTVRFTFRPGAPRAEQAMRNGSLRLVREITEDQREIVRNALQDSLRRGENPRKAARVFRDSIGLTQRQERAVQNFRRALEEGRSAALSRELRDRRFDATVRRAVAGEIDLTDDQIDRMTERYRARMLKHRSEVIARTESLRALSEGKDAARQQMIDEGLVREDQIRRFWRTSGDERVRANHRAIPGMNPDGVGPNATFQTPGGPLRYPRDPRGTAANTVQCRCSDIERIVDFEEMEGVPA